MISIVNFAELVVATIFAAGLAASFHWLLLRVTFYLMQPAAVRKPVRAPLAPPVNRRLARALASHS